MPGERKLVTVLFADIVGSTAVGFAHDPEVVREWLSRTFDVAREALEAHGGTVEKFIGDAVMAVFGVPTAHDDDPDRAVRAAFALLERVAELRREGLPFELRIGINSGEAVAGSAAEGYFLVTGPVVNIAARLEQAASPGEILVGSFTKRATESVVRYDPPRDVNAKGIGGVEAYPARELATAVPAQRHGVEGLHAPLIGRDNELRLLRDAFGRLADERAASLVTVTGIAGAGKSRLVSEFVAGIGPERVLIGRCLPYGEGITFYPIQQAIGADAGLDLAMPRDEALVRLRAAVARLVEPDEAERVLKRLEVVFGLAEARDALPEIATNEVMEEVRWGVRRYLERRATGPLVLVFEDVHWAERALLDLVEHVSTWARAPLLVLCTARPEFTEIRPGFGASAKNAQAIELPPLPAVEIRRLIGELLGGDALSEQAIVEIVARADGNPLYVEEFLRTLIEMRWIRRANGGWVMSDVVGELGIPPTLRGLITARLDRLAPGVKRVVQAASIVGRLFSTSALALLTDTGALSEPLREAVRVGVIVEVDESAPGEGRAYRFKHPLFREVAHDTTTKADRLKMHDKYGRWLEATLGERAVEVREVLGYHAEQAYLCSRDLERSGASQLGRRAVVHLVAAADSARDRFDQHAAWKLYERAATIADSADAEPGMRAHVRGYATLGRLLFMSADGNVVRAFEDAISLARSTRAGRVLVDLLIWYARYAVERSHEMDLARQIVSELPRLAESSGDQGLLADTLQSCGWLAYCWGDREAEKDFYLAALKAGRRGSRPQSVRRTLQLLARRSRRFEGDYQKASEFEREIDDMPAPTSLVERMYWQGHLSNSAYDRGDFAAAREHAIDAQASARELGSPFFIALAEWRVADTLIGIGTEERAALEMLEHGAQILERLKYRGHIPELRARAAIVCLRFGDREAARTHVAAAEAAVIPFDAEGRRITVQARALLLAAEGDVKGAENAARSELARIEPLGYGFDIAQLRMCLGEILFAAGRGAEGRSELAKARLFFSDPLARGWQEKVDALMRTANYLVAEA